MKQSNRAFNRGSILIHLLLALAGTGVVSYAMWASLGLFQTQPGGPRAQPVTRTEVMAAAFMSGLDCESLLAANVTRTQFAGVFVDLASYLRAHPDVMGDHLHGPQSLFETGIASLTQAQQATLRTIRSNADWKLPASYKVVERSKAEWYLLREAIVDERIVTRDGGEMPLRATSTLGRVRANTGVSAALQRVATGELSRTAWTAAATNAAAQ